jgi:hypothetical protein
MKGRKVHTGAKARKARQSRLKAKRSQRLKYLAAAIILLFLIGDLIPLAIADIAPERPSSDFGVSKQLQDIQETRTSDTWAKTIHSEAQGALNSIDVTHVDRQPVSIEEQVVLMGPTPPQDPDLFSTIELTTLPNRTTLLDFLINQPMSYYVYTKSNGHEKWSEGLLRPSILGGFNPNGTLINWEKWVYVDVDDNVNTGEEHGYDVRARIDIRVDQISIERPHFLPPYRKGQAHIKGGVALQVEKLSGTNATPNLPLEVAIIKSYSYTGNNFLWMFGFKWQDMPNTFQAYLQATDIILQTPELDPFGIFNMSFIDSSNVVNISGPYDIDLAMDTRPKDMDILIGYAKIQLFNLTERVWASIKFDPADGMDRIAEHYHINLQSPSFNKSFDKLYWTATAPIRLEAIFKQVAETTTYVDLTVADVPATMSLELNSIVGVHGEAASNVAFQASAKIKTIDYVEFEFYGSDASTFTHSHVIIKDLPKVLNLNGTFQIGGDDVPPPDNPTLAFPSRFVDNMMRKISGKFYRVAKTLRTIPDNIIHMPDKKGYADLQVDGPDPLGTIEFYVSSKSRVEAEGNYIAFRNDSAELGLDGSSSSNLINSSLSGRLTDINRMYLDFTNGTVLDLDLKGPRPLKVLFIDDGNDAKAVMSLNDVPQHFYLKFHPDTIHIRSDEPLKVLSYTSLVGSRYFRMELDDLPTDLTIHQNKGRMMLQCAPGTSLGSFYLVVTDQGRLTVPNMDYNHIFLDRTVSSYFSSIRLRDIIALDTQTAAGGFITIEFAKERDLYMDLSDSIQDVQGKLLFSPFPSNFSIELPMGFATSGIRLPNVLNVTSLFAFSPILLQMDKLSGDILTMTTELTDNLAAQLGSVGSNTTLKLKSKVLTTLIADLRKGPAEDIRWVHGVNIAIDSVHKSIRGKIYLRLPLEASINMQTKGDAMAINIDFKHYDPIWEFLDVRITGMADRDVALFIDDIPKEPTDLKVAATLDVNMTPGKSKVIAKVDMQATKDLGPMYMNIRKFGALDSITTVYASSVPKKLKMDVDVSDHIALNWEASGPITNVYVLMQKAIDSKWYDVTLTLNKVPQTVHLSVGSSTSHPLDMDGSLLQGLPEVMVSAPTSSMSLYLYAEGPALGMPQTIEIRMGGITDQTSTTYDESDGIYKVRAQGLSYLYMHISNLPLTEKVKVTQLELYADEVYSLDLKVDMALGTLPIIDVSNLDVSSLQLRAKSKMTILGQERTANLVLVDVSFDGIVPRSAQFTKNGLSVSGGDHHIIVPAPIASLMATLLGGG